GQAAERVAGDGLDAAVDGEDDVALGGRVGEEAGQVPELERRGAAGELRVVLALDAGGAEPERVVPGDVGVELALGVDPPVAEVGPACPGGRRHHAGGG